MPLDDDVKRELDSIRAELRDELRAATSNRERELVRSENRADLEDVLRAEGYRLSRRELDDLVSARDDARLEAKLDALLDARAAAAREAEEGEEGEEGEGEDGKKKPAGRRKTKTPATGSDDETEEEWT